MEIETPPTPEPFDKSGILLSKEIVGVGVEVQVQVGVQVGVHTHTYTM